MFYVHVNSMQLVVMRHLILYLLIQCDSHVCCALAAVSTLYYQKSTALSSHCDPCQNAYTLLAVDIRRYIYSTHLILEDF